MRQMASLGENIAALRVENGLTQVQLGEKLCVSAQAVSKWERNLSQPDIVTMRKMAALFGVTIESMLDEDDAQYEEEYEEEDEAYDEEQADDEEESAPTYVCMTCGKMCREDEVQQKDGKAICPACLERALAQERKKRREEQERKRVEQAKKEEEQRRQQQYRRAAAARQLHKSLILASVATVVWLITFIITCVVLESGVGTGIVFGIISLYAVFASVFELSLPQSVLRRFYAKLFPKRPDKMPRRNSGCLHVILLLLFGLIYVFIFLAVITFFYFATFVVSMVSFPPDFRSCRRSSMY